MTAVPCASATVAPSKGILKYRLVASSPDCEQSGDTPPTTSNNCCFIEPAHCGISSFMSDGYSEETFRAILATADEWYEAFAQSNHFAKLSDSQQRKAGAITKFFARSSYECLGLPPGQWDRGAVVECCIEILPRKMSAELSLFEAVAPVLTAFFSFLEDRSLLPNGRALAEDAASIHAEIIAQARDRGSCNLVGISSWPLTTRT